MRPRPKGFQCVPNSYQPQVTCPRSCHLYLLSAPPSPVPTVPLMTLSVPVLPRSAGHLLLSVTLLTPTLLCPLLAYTVCAWLPRPCGLSPGLCWLFSRCGPVVYCCSGQTARYSLSFLCVSWKIMLPFWVHFFFIQDAVLIPVYYATVHTKKEISNAYGE